MAAELFLLALLCASLRQVGAKVELNFGACYDFSHSLFASLLAKVALDEGYFDDILPAGGRSADFTVAVRPAFTQCNGAVASRMTMPLFLGMGEEPGRIYSANVSESPVVAVAGCSCSAATLQVSNLAASYTVPIVSGASTNAGLSNKALHPYFARVVPPDSMQGSVLVAVVQQFGWRRVFSVFPSEPYAQGISTAFKARLVVKGDNIVFVEYPLPWQPLSTPADAKTFDPRLWSRVVEQIARESPQPRIFLAAGVQLDHVVRIFRDQGFVGNATFWLVSEACCTGDGFDNIANMLPAIRLADPDNPWWIYPWGNTSRHIRGMMCPVPQSLGWKFYARPFQDFLARLTFGKLLAAGWKVPAGLSWEEAWLNATTWPDSFYRPLYFDAAAVLMLAAGSLLGRGLPAASIRGEVLLNEVRASRFQSVSGTIAFDENGDRLANYTIRNMRLAATGEPVLDPVGSYDSLLERMSWTATPLFADGTTNVPLDVPAPCPPGYEDQGILRGCVACLAGHYSPGGSTVCQECTVGSFQALPGQAACLRAARGCIVNSSASEHCQACAAGRFAADLGSTACDPCDAGTFASGSGMSACQPAPPGTYVAGNAATGAARCPIGTFTDGPGKSECSSCGGGSYQVTTGATACEQCERGYYLSGDTCKACGPFTSTAGPGATAADACKLDGGGVGFIIACGFGALLLSAAAAGAIFNMRRRMRKYEQEKERHVQETVKEGLLTVQELGHPMVLIRAPDFIHLTWEQLGGLHEGVRNMGKLVILDTLEHVESARRNGMVVIFFSYQWLSWDRNGPSPVQFDCMKEAAARYASASRCSLRKLCIWLDVLAIPQCHDGVKKLAIRSLYTYAACSNALIVIAPESVHSNTNTVANLRTYQSRIWTRTEQVAHLSCHDISTILIAAPRGLVPITEAWVRDVLCIFDAEMTCCRLKHVGMSRCEREMLVVPVLGLWYILTASKLTAQTADRPFRTGGDLLYELIHPQKDRVFPPYYDYVTEHGTERRELFGDCIHRVEAIVKRQFEKNALVMITAPTMRADSRISESSNAGSVLPAEFQVQFSDDDWPDRPPDEAEEEEVRTYRLRAC